MTAQDLIQAALRLVGVTVSGETPTNAEMQDALSALNMIINEWAAQRLLSIAAITENFSLTAGTYAYNIGAGQTFNTVKPLQIKAAFIRDSRNNDSLLEIINFEQWDALPDKATLTGTPMYLYFNPTATQQATPTGVINLYPAPDAGSAYTLYLESQKPFTEFASLTDAYTFPTAYEKAVKFRLAVEIAPEYGRGAPPEVAALAADALKTVKALNAAGSATPARFEFGGVSKYNINAG